MTPWTYNRMNVASQEGTHGGGWEVVREIIQRLLIAEPMVHSNDVPFSTSTSSTILTPIHPHGRRPVALLELDIVINCSRISTSGCNMCREPLEPHKSGYLRLQGCLTECTHILQEVIGRLSRTRPCLEVDVDHPETRLKAIRPD